LSDDRQPLYLQARYLEPPLDRGKYDNPSAQHGSNPRLTTIEPVGFPTAGPILVTEGVPDALAAATAGFRAVAILGAGLADQLIAESLARHHSGLVLAFDRDEAGRSGSERLHQLLLRRGCCDVAALLPRSKDLNAWLIERGPAAFGRELRMGFALARAPITGLARTRSTA
jgi:hypothetical protein